MSGYYNHYKYTQKPRYRPKNFQKPEPKPEKSEAVQASFPLVKDEGVQIDMGDGIPCRIIPINPEDYPRLLALLNIHQSP